VPQYRSVRVLSTGTLTTSPYAGLVLDTSSRVTTGILAMFVSGSLQLSLQPGANSIDV
jgi:hypothetical protein